MWDAAEAWLEDKVDVLMNNAGVFSRADWRPMADINMTGLLAGTMLAMQAAAIEEALLWCTKECTQNIFFIQRSIKLITSQPKV